VIYSGTPRPSSRSPPSVARAAAISNRASGFSPQWRGFVDAKGSSMPLQTHHIYCLRFEAAALGISRVALASERCDSAFYVECSCLLRITRRFGLFLSLFLSLSLSLSLPFSMPLCRTRRCCGFPTVPAFLSTELFQVDYITQRIYRERREHQGERRLFCSLGIKKVG